MNIKLHRFALSFMLILSCLKEAVAQDLDEAIPLRYNRSVNTAQSESKYYCYPHTHLVWFNTICEVTCEQIDYEEEVFPGIGPYGAFWNCSSSACNEDSQITIDQACNQCGGNGFVSVDQDGDIYNPPSPCGAL